MSNGLTAKGRRKRGNAAGAWLKRARVAVSLAMLAVCCALFTTLTAEIALSLDWVARLQLVPLTLAGCTSALAAWVALTLVFGRLYCSWFCPMGVLQDIFARLRRLTRKQAFRHRYAYSRPKNRLRYIWLGIIVAASAAGAGVLLSLFDPYSAFGRVISRLVRPLWGAFWGNEVAVSSVAAFVVALATISGIGAVAAWRGRLYCNTLCPVGTSLSVLSRHSLFHFDIDTDLCVNCGACGRVCKSECVDQAAHVVDGSRCVMCFDCVAACGENAIRYTTNRKKLSIPLMQRVERPAPSSAAVKIDRRRFMATGLLLAATPTLDSVAGWLGMPGGRKDASACRPVAPPGRRGMKEFLERCTGCGLCVAHCPQRVLKPSAGQLGWLSMLHPVMDYDRSYCLYDCVMCTEVCPTEALQPLTVDEKHIFIIGRATADWDLCVGCGICARACPRGAITMAAPPKPEADGAPARGWYVPYVDTSLCIGCGVCQNRCPAHPAKAISVCGIT